MVVYTAPIKLSGSHKLRNIFQMFYIKLFCTIDGIGKVTLKMYHDTVTSFLWKVITYSISYKVA